MKVCLSDILDPMKKFAPYVLNSRLTFIEISKYTLKRAVIIDAPIVSEKKAMKTRLLLTFSDLNKIRKNIRITNIFDILSVTIKHFRRVKFDYKP